jgi:hypothetical protein
MTKLEDVKYDWNNGDRITALKKVAKFPRLGKEKDAIKLAVDCINNPSFYRQIGKDIDACIDAGIDAVQTKYKLED